MSATIFFKNSTKESIYLKQIINENAKEVDKAYIIYKITISINLDY